MPFLFFAPPNSGQFHLSIQESEDCPPRLLHFTAWLPTPATAGRQQPQTSPDPPLAAHTKRFSLLVDSLRRQFQSPKLWACHFPILAVQENSHSQRCSFAPYPNTLMATPLDQSPKPACLPKGDTSFLSHPPPMPSCFHLPSSPTIPETHTERPSPWGGQAGPSPGS